MNRLQCAAPHPDKRDQTCNSLLAFGHGFTVVGTSYRAPEEEDDQSVWMRCDRCKAWTQFRIPNMRSEAA